MAALVHSIQKSFRFLTSTGSAGANPQDTRQILLTNRLAILTACIAGTLALVEFFLGWQTLATLMLPTTLLLLLPLALNGMRFPNLAGIIQLILLNAFTFLFTVTLDSKIGTRNFFFLLEGLPLVLFSLQKRKEIALGVLLPLTLYFVSHGIDSTVFPDLYGSVSVPILTHLAQGALFVLAFLVFYHFRTLSDEFEHQLTQSTRQLVATSRLSTLGEMAGGLAHEINNPLAIIHLKATQLKEALEEPAPDRSLLTHSIEQIEKTTQRIARIIQSLRWFSRSTSADPLFRTSVHHIIEDTLILCAERLRESSIELRYTPAAVDWHLDCRAPEISQILYQLVSNARDAVATAPKKWIEIQVQERGPTHLAISVTDSGSGVPEKIRDKIFQPFFTTKTIGQGTGTGLSIAYGIAQSHGGTLTLDPESPHTRFVLELPSPGRPL